MNLNQQSLGNPIHSWRVSAINAMLIMIGAQLSSAATAGLPSKLAANVDETRLLAADREPGNWLAPGRTPGEQHFSPLRTINPHNVRKLGLAWFADLDSAQRGQESTPLVIDGVMYVTSAWSKVFALDAKTGAGRWSFDPNVPGQSAINACCDTVNRGVAAWKGRLYLGTLDGRLIALEAKTGRPVWEVMTVPAGGRYTITGAPRVWKGMVIIGNGGGEMGIRGYVSAYDAASGKLRWRFYTVPGDPSQPYENAAMKQAAATWSGEWWKLGGGGPVWDSMAFDPSLNLIYIGVGNGTPWNRRNLKGDSLYLSSIVALRIETGEYVWHYQTTPGDEWDFDACSPLVLADLVIQGRKRSVLMQAPKNGFFYVIDRRSGELLSADPFTVTNWAARVDLKTGRPVENPDARYGESGKPFVAMPGPGGAHAWQPMSFSGLTGLVYLPVTEMGFPYIPETVTAYRTLGWNTGVDFNAGSLPQDPAVKAQIKASLKGHLAAWDPVIRKEVWRAELGHPWNGGVVATAGNLVFQGTGMGEFVAYRADNGERLWSADTEAGVLAAPISYAVDGEQYIAVEVGWGGSFGLAAGELARDSHSVSNLPRVLVYKLGGTAALPARPDAPQPQLNRLEENASADLAGADLAEGKLLYHRYCSTCHGDAATSSGVLPDLRYSSQLGNPKGFEAVVLEGTRADQGMIGFKEAILPVDLENIRAYLIQRAAESARAGER